MFDFRRWVGGSLALGTLSLGLPVSAAPVGDPEAPGEVSVLVTGRRDASAHETPQATNVIDAERLEELQPRSVAEALRNQPGVWVQRTGHSGGAPILRGFMGNRVLYLFDGVRRNTASIFGGPNGFLNHMDPSAVRRIEVIRGPGSVLYGSDAVGGVINVITGDQVRFSREGLEVGGRATSWFETVDEGLGVGGEVSLATEDIMVNLGGGYLGVQDVSGGGDAGTLSPTAFNQWGVDGQLAVRLGQGYVEALAQVFRRPEDSRYDRPTWESESERALYQVRYRSGSLGFADRLEVDTWYHDQGRATDRGNRRSEDRDQTVGAELRLKQRLGPVAATWGLHYHRDWVASEEVRAGTDGAPGRVTRAPDATWDNPAVFALADYSPLPALTLTVGLRGDVFRLASEAPPENSVSAGLTPEDLAIERTNAALTGGIGAVYRINEHLNWLAHFGSAYRAPGTNDYLETGEFTFGYRVPSPDPIAPERSYTVETGLSLQHDRFEGQLTLFHTWLTDTIGSALTRDFPGGRYVDADGDGRTGAAEDADGDDVDGSDEETYAAANLGSATSLGGEIAGRVWALPSLAVYFNASYVYGEVDAGERGATAEPLERAYPMNGTLGLRWQSDRRRPRFWAEVEGHGAAAFDRLASGRAARDPAFLVDPQDSDSGTLLEGCAGDGSFEGCRLPGYFVVNARGGARLFDQVHLTVNLENLADARYRVKDSRLDAPGFNARMGLTASF